MKTSPELPAFEQVNSALSYDPDTGIFRRKIGSSKSPVGSIAGHKNKRGYVYINVAGSPRLAHRLAWLIVTGKWPESQIDHRNGDASDNRFENLRPATNAQNQVNQGIHKNNKSGFKGVSWSKEKRKWEARIMIGGKSKFLGYFAEAKAGGKAYDSAGRELFGEFHRLK